MPAIVREEDAKALYNATQQTDTVSIRIDLSTQTICCHTLICRFMVDDFRKHALYHGLDDIGQTLHHAEEIRIFETKHRQLFPWLYSDD